MRSALLLVNPAAGRIRSDGRRLDHLRNRLTDLGLECRTVLTRPGLDTVPRLDFNGTDLVIVCGGDGTLHNALPQLVEGRRPLCLLPAGTANVLARELKIPLDLEAALRTLATGRLRRIHLGQTGARLFHLMAGIGLDSFIIERVRPRWKKALGSYSYWISGLTNFWSYPFGEFEAVLDGSETHRATFAVVANVSSYGGHLNMAPRASPFEPCLDVCLFTSRRPRRFLRYLAAALNGKHLALPDVVYRKVRQAEIRGAASLGVQMDGEPAGELPMTFSVAPQSLEILCP